MEPILQTKKLDLRYGAFQALYGIDTDIFPNEITALIGPSGCGKSTYLKTLNRMNDLVPGCKIDGAVLFHGHNVYGDKIDVTELRSRIGMVFQSFNLFLFFLSRKDLNFTFVKLVNRNGKRFLTCCVRYKRLCSGNQLTGTFACCKDKRITAVQLESLIIVLVVCVDSLN